MVIRTSWPWDIATKPTHPQGDPGSGDIISTAESYTFALKLWCLQGSTWRMVQTEEMNDLWNL